MSGDKLISILEKDFKKAFTFEFDFNNESNELKLNEIPCPNGEFDQKSIEKYNDNAAKEINRQMGKLREVIKANEKSFNEKKIDEWVSNKSSAFSKLKSIVLASVKKNNVVLFSNFCSHVPAQNLYDLIFNVNKLILSIVVSKLKMLVDSASTNEHLKHQIAENEKKIAELKKEHDAILKEHNDNSGKATAGQQAELERLNKIIADNEKRMKELEDEHERKIKDHNDNSEKLTAEQKQKQQEEIERLNKMIADKEATIEKLHTEHKEKIETHEASASQLSDTQKKELEELKQTLEKLKAENKHLAELNVKRDKFEKDGINKLVNIIKTAQNLVDVNDTKKPLSNDVLGDSSDFQAPPSHIPPPPPLD
jgi:flagellar motility protein MotE (MotC chaperone)